MPRYKFVSRLPTGKYNGTAITWLRVKQTYITKWGTAMSDIIVYNNPSEQFLNADALVEQMHKRAKHLILDIRGKQYPTVNYYTAFAK